MHMRQIEDKVKDFIWNDDPEENHKNRVIIYGCIVMILITIPFLWSIM